MFMKILGSGEVGAEGTKRFFTHLNQFSADIYNITV